MIHVAPVPKPPVSVEEELVAVSRATLDAVEGALRDALALLDDPAALMARARELFVRSRS